MKKGLITFIIGILLLSSCGNKDYLVAVRLRHAGSVIFWEKNGEKYKFEGDGTSENTTKGYIHWTDYIYNKNGKQFNLVKGKEIVDSTTLISVETLNSNIYEFNLDTIEKCVIIENYMDNIRIFSSNPNIERDISICVESRTNPLNITFTDINIKPKTFIPAFFNFSEVDINMNFEGSNRIEAGESNLTYAEIDFFENLINDAVDAVIEDLIEYKYYHTLKEFVDLSEAAKASDDYYSFMMNVSGEMVNLAKEGLDYFENLIFGSAGVKGFDGHAAISSVDGISLLGKGNVTIVGGAGACGSNAIGGIYGNNGGNGGNGGPGILSKTVAIINNNTEIIGGTPGNGGLKNEGIVGDNAYNGAKGKRGTQVSSKYYFKAR